MLGRYLDIWVDREMDESVDVA